ncbi:MAG: hypothetical protein WDW36_007817 [Sanguina aurantia]
MEKLLSWATSQGGRLHKVAIDPVHGRQFVAVDDINSNEAVIFLPQSLLMHAGLALKDAEYGAAFRQLQTEAGAALDPRSMLCMLLVLETTRHQLSFFHPYIAALPETYDDPYWWAPETVSPLAGTRLGRAVEQHRPHLHQLAAWMVRLEQIHRSLAPACSAAPCPLTSYRDGWGLTVAATRWARSSVWSRSFTIHRLANGESSVVCLVPVLDMLDHNPAAEVVWHTWPEGDKDFQFVLLKPLARGCTVYNNYGHKSNDELLLGYGFCIPSNINDDFPISVKASSKPGPHSQGISPPVQQQQQQQQQQQLVAQDQACTRRGPSDVCDEGGQKQDEDEDREDGPDEEQELQGATEQLQRQVVAAALGLRSDFKLSVRHPLPAELLRAVWLQAAPPSSVYFALCGLLATALPIASLVRSPTPNRDCGQTPAEPAHAHAHAHAGGNAPGTALDGATTGVSDQQQQQQQQEQEEEGNLIAAASASNHPPGHTSAVSASFSEPVSRARGHSHSAAPPTTHPPPTPSSMWGLCRLAPPPLAETLQALGIVRQQLESKSAALAATQRLLDATSRALTPQRPLHGASVPAPSEAAGPGPASGVHLSLAQVYVRGQAGIITASLAAVAAAISHSLAAASGPPAAAGSPAAAGPASPTCRAARAPTPAAVTPTSDTTAAADAYLLSGWSEQQRQSWQAHCTTLLSSSKLQLLGSVAPTSGCTPSQGVTPTPTASRTPAATSTPAAAPHHSTPTASQPRTCLPSGVACALGSSQLVLQLMAAAHPQVTDGDACGADRPPGGATDGGVGGGLLWWLMQHIRPPPGSRLQLLSATSKAARRVLAVLAGCRETPVCAQPCLDANDSGGAMPGGSWQAYAAGWSGDSGGLDASSAAAVTLLMRGPQAFSLFLWASAVVDSCAVRVATPPEHAAGRAGPLGCIWLLCPFISAIPQALRDAALHVTLARGDAGCLAAASVVVTAACDLPAGTHLSHTTLLAGMDTLSAMREHGPELLSPPHQHHTAAGSLDPAPGTTPQQQLQLLQGAQSTKGDLIPEAAGGAPGCHVSAAAGPSPVPVPVPVPGRAAAVSWYELCVLPAEDAPLAQLKVQLLVASGLGGSHYLRGGAHELVALLGALTICHADEHVLSSPLVHQCLQLHQAQQLATHRSDPVSPTTPPSPGATPAADLDPPGCAGSGPPSASVGVAPGPRHTDDSDVQGLTHILHQAQVLLLQELLTLSPKHPVAKAARPTLNRPTTLARDSKSGVLPSCRKQLQFLLRKGCKSTVSKEASLQRLLDAAGGFVAGVTTVGSAHEQQLLQGALCYVSGIRIALQASIAACADVLLSLSNM